VVHKLGKPASEVCRRFEPVPQVLRNVRFSGGKPLDHPAVAKAIAAARERLGDRGRLLVRPSGTEPVIRVMGEADDQALVDALVGEVCEAVAGAA
jgi:phosphoglucosamine mutase